MRFGGALDLKSYTAKEDLKNVKLFLSTLLKISKLIGIQIIIEVGRIKNASMP